VYKPVCPFFSKWAKSKSFIQEDLTISEQCRGQGHAHYEFTKAQNISVEITKIESEVTVAWQNGERTTQNRHGHQLLSE
jgi:hypothetical protein